MLRHSVDRNWTLENFKRRNRSGNRDNLLESTFNFWRNLGEKTNRGRLLGAMPGRTAVARKEGRGLSLAAKVRPASAGSGGSSVKIDETFGAPIEARVPFPAEPPALPCPRARFYLCVLEMEPFAGLHLLIYTAGFRYVCVCRAGGKGIGGGQAPRGARWTNLSVRLAIEVQHWSCHVVLYGRFLALLGRGSGPLAWGAAAPPRGKRSGIGEEGEAKPPRCRKEPRDFRRRMMADFDGRSGLCWRRERSYSLKKQERKEHLQVGYTRAIDAMEELLEATCRALCFAYIRH